jgi:hypothetical protein
MIIFFYHYLKLFKTVPYISIKKEEPVLILLILGGDKINNKG